MPVPIVWNLVPLSTALYSLAAVLPPPTTGVAAHADLTGLFYVADRHGSEAVRGLSTDAGLTALVEAQRVAEAEWRAYSEGPWNG